MRTYIILVLLVLSAAAGLASGQAKEPEPEKTYYYSNREPGKTPVDVWMFVGAGCWNITRVVTIQGKLKNVQEYPCVPRVRYTRPEAKN